MPRQIDWHIIPGLCLRLLPRRRAAEPAGTVRPGRTVRLARPARPARTSHADLIGKISDSESAGADIGSDGGPHAGDAVGDAAVREDPGGILDVVFQDAVGVARVGQADGEVRADPAVLADQVGQQGVGVFGAPCLACDDDFAAAHRKDRLDGKDVSDRRRRGGDPSAEL